MAWHPREGDPSKQKSILDNIKNGQPRAIEATSPRLHLLDGVEVHHKDSPVDFHTASDEYRRRGRLRRVPLAPPFARAVAHHEQRVLERD